MNNPSDYTTNPLSLATQVAVEPEFIRLPRYGERDPVFGLSPGLSQYAGPAVESQWLQAAGEELRVAQTRRQDRRAPRRPQLPEKLHPPA